jgi:5-methylcytosine-specific restriction endonuclease McrA
MTYDEAMKESKRTSKVFRRQSWPDLTKAVGYCDDLIYVYEMDERQNAGGYGHADFEPTPDDLSANDWEKWDGDKLFPDRSRPASEMTKEETKLIWKAVDALVERLSLETDLCPEAVANSAFYRLQRHPDWARNATQTQKRVSHAARGGKCFRCGEEVAFKDATFHHLLRGVPDQHGPANLVPFHEKCHDEEHKAEKASLMKGSPRRRKPKTDEPG